MPALFVRAPPRPDTRWYHTNFLISECKVRSFQQPLTRNDAPKLKELGPEGQSFVKGLFRILGVKSVEISPYQLSLYISQAVHWDYVERMLIELTKFTFVLDELQIVDEASAPVKKSWKVGGGTADSGGGAGGGSGEK